MKGNELNIEALEKVTGGTIKNTDALKAYIKQQKEAGWTLTQITSVLFREPTIHNYTDDLDIFGVITFATNYFNSLPGAQGSFQDGVVSNL